MLLARICYVGLAFFTMFVGQIYAAHPRWSSRTQLVQKESEASQLDELMEKLLVSYLAKHPQWTWTWTWGPGILLYGLERYGSVATNNPIFWATVQDFHTHHEHGPWQVNWADQCTPALSSFWLNEDVGLKQDTEGLQKVLYYLRNTKRNELNSIDHFPDGSIASPFFPDSIWVDSLMMWAVLSVQYGSRYDESLFDFGVDQARVFAATLWNDKNRLFHHAWNLDKAKLYPVDNAHWLRGNAWVAVYLVETLEVLSPGDRRYAEIFMLYNALMRRLMLLQKADGLWDTLVAEPGAARSETSGSALVAYSLAKGSRLHLLSEDAEKSAWKAFTGLQSYLVPRSKGLALGGISKGTNPGNREYYLSIGQAENLSYGVGGMFLLASELRRIMK